MFAVVGFGIWSVTQVIARRTAVISNTCFIWSASEIPNDAMGRSGILSRLSGREISYRMQILDKVLSSRKIVVQVINAAREALRLYRPRNTDFAD